MKKNTANLNGEDSWKRNQSINPILYLIIVQYYALNLNPSYPKPRVKQTPTQTEITERFIASQDHNRCRFVFMQFLKPYNRLQKQR